MEFRVPSGRTMIVVTMRRWFLGAGGWSCTTAFSQEEHNRPATATMRPLHGNSQHFCRRAACTDAAELASHQAAF
jgi:hypothetical protein